MSTRFWIFCAGSIGIAAGLGLGLGGYAVGEGPVGWRTEPTAAALSDPIAAPPAAPPAAAPGPAIIRCKGCGPTLAERRMAADIAELNGAELNGAELDGAGLDGGGLIAGTRDPVVRDYMTLEDRPAATRHDPAADPVPVALPGRTTPDQPHAPPKGAPPYGASPKVASQADSASAPGVADAAPPAINAVPSYGNRVPPS